MLGFVIGRACSGKSNYIVRKAAEASLSKKTIIIVPEQFTFETERAVLHIDNYNSENIEVLSFTKLYSVVAALSGFGQLPVMSDSERLLLTDAAFKSSAEQLRIFDKYVNYSDFSVKIADIIRDFKFAAAKSEDIMSAAEEIGGSCGAKLHDIAVIMSVYDALISDKFIDSSDYLTRLFSVLGDFHYFDGKEVFFDSFTGFTGQQMKIIERILEQADDVTFSFCTDDTSNTDLNVFYNINKTARKIKEIAKSRNVKIGETLHLKENFYIVGEALDVDGDCGGYNLTFAFVSGIISARSIRYLFRYCTVVIPVISLNTLQKCPSESPASSASFESSTVS